MSINQTICEGNAITPIVFELLDGANTANVTGLPAGITYNIDGTTLTISGTPSGVTANQLFNYTIQPVNDTTGCTGNSFAGLISVAADSEITDTSYNRYQTINEGESIEPIELTIGGGATDVAIASASGADLSWINITTNGTSVTLTGTPATDIIQRTEYDYFF